MRISALVIASFAALAVINCGSIEPTAPTTVSPGSVPSRSNNGGTGPRLVRRRLHADSPTPTPAVIRCPGPERVPFK